MNNYIIIISVILILVIILLFYKNKKDISEHFENNNNFIALVYENEENTPTTNLVKLFEKFNYNHKILGKNAKWEGWYGRTQEYLKELNNLDKESYVLICDGRDVLINQHFDIFFKKAVEMYNKYNTIIFSSELYCCNGYDHFPVEKNNENFDNNKDIFMKFMKEQAYKIIPDYKYDYYYLNFGVMFGKVKDAINIFTSIEIKPGQDDQGLTQRLFYRNPNILHLDYNQELFTNISYACDFDWDEELKQYKLKKTNTYPSILHFPGKHFSCYDTIKEKLI